MKTSKLLVFVMMLAFTAACDTAGTVEPSFDRTFLKYYGNEGDQSAADLIVVNDGFLLLGNSTSLGGQKSAFLIKTSPTGDVIWERQVGGLNETAVDIEQILDSENFVVVLNVGPEQSSQIRLLRLNGRTGAGLDSAMLPLHENGGFKQVARSITPLGSNEFLVVGYSDGNLIDETDPINSDNDASDILALRVGSDLSVIDLVVTKGGEQHGSAIKAFEYPGDPSEKIVLFSYSDRPKETAQFIYNFSYDIVTQGIPVGKQLGSASKNEILANVVEVPEEMGQGFLMVGTSRQGLDGSGSIYVVKYDEYLQHKGLDQEIDIGRNVECVSATVGNNAYYILSDELTPSGFRDINISKLTRQGEVMWSKSFGTRTGDDTASAIASLPDGRIAVAGTVQLQTRLKVALMVMDNEGSF